jgi:hypothetical protein
VPFPNPDTLLGRRTATWLAREALVAEAMGRQAADFEGNAHEYRQAVYRGEIKPDALRMAAAATALRVEKPALAAIAAKVDSVTFARELDAACRRAGLEFDAGTELKLWASSRKIRFP